MVAQLDMGTPPGQTERTCVFVVYMRLVSEEPYLCRDPHCKDHRRLGTAPRRTTGTDPTTDFGFAQQRT
jgi:hypothetical protein